MTISLPRLPDEIAVGMQVTFTSGLAKNTGESGVSGRKLLSPVLRNYLVDVSPEISNEIQAIVMAVRGSRYPLAFLDPTACSLSDDAAVVAADGLSATLYKTWQPATGSLTYQERVLIIDQDSGPFSFTVNGNAPTSGSWTLGDYGVLHFSPAIAPTDVVLATGQYLKPVCILDPPTLTTFGRTQNDHVGFQFSSLRLEEIFEAELITLTS